MVYVNTMTLKYIPIWSDDPDIVPYPGKLKNDYTLGAKYRIARSILTDMLGDIDLELFRSMSWDKPLIREKQRHARADLKRYHDALSEIGGSEASKRGKAKEEL
jgi:hypothetical protein